MRTKNTLGRGIALLLTLALLLTVAPFSRLTSSAQENIDSIDSSHLNGGVEAQVYSTGYADSGITIPSALPRRAIREILPQQYNNDIDALLYQSSVKNQGSDGLCWAFTAMAAIESATIKAYEVDAEDIDLSEYHAAFALSYENDNNLGFMRTVSYGGNDLITMAYLMRGNLRGAVKEEDVPNTADWETVTGALPAYTVPNVWHITDDFPSRLIDKHTTFQPNMQTAEIKKSVLNYGAVSTSIFADYNITTYEPGSTANWNLETSSYFVSNEFSDY